LSKLVWSAALFVIMLHMSELTCMAFDREVAVQELLGKQRPFTRADIQTLRNPGAITLLNQQSVMFRAEIELIDAMIVLNTSTTRLMWVAIAVAVMGVLVSAAQIIAAFMLRR
jgi:hypothetical protein